jgi:hypothetical protein
LTVSEVLLVPNIYFDSLYYFHSLAYFILSQSQQNWLPSFNVCNASLFCNAGSESNSSTLTFDGVDVTGDRLAEEVCDGFGSQF